MANDKPILIVSTSLNEAESKKQIQKSLDKLGKQLSIQIGVGKNGSQDVSKQIKGIKDLTQSNKGYINGLNNLLHLMKTKQITDDKALANLNKLRQNQQFANLTQQKQIALVNAMEKANNNYTKSVDARVTAEKKINEEAKKQAQITASKAQSKTNQDIRVSERTQEKYLDVKTLSEIAKKEGEILLKNINKYQLSKQQREEAENYLKIIKGINVTQEMSEKQLREQNRLIQLNKREMQTVYSDVRATGRGALNFGVMFESAIKSMSIWMAASTVFFQTVRAIQSGVQTIFEFDKAMTELRKVSEESDESLQAFGETAEKIGAQVGRTSTEVVQATSDFVKMGYSLRQASEMAKDALILTNVGDGFTDVAQASEALVTTLKGFNLNASETTHIIDSLNELSNKYAVNSVDLAEALKRSSAVMALSGNTFEETLAMYTSGIEILQSPEKVSRGLTTISQRLRGMSEEGEKITALMPKLQDTFDTYAKGVKITADDGSLRSTYDILTDLSRVWGTLTSKQQQYVGEIVAGKDQVKTLAAILQNKKVLLEANTVALTSSGSALKENAIYLQSLEGRVKSFNQAVEQLWKGTIDGGFIKSIVSLGTMLVKLVDELNLVQVAIVSLSYVMFSSLIPAIFSTTGHFVKLFAVLKANPYVFLASAIAGVVFWLNEQQNVTEKLIASSQDNLTSMKDETDESIKLAQAVEDLSDVQNRTYEESVKLKEAKAELIRLYPELKSIIESETTKQGELEQAIRKVTSARIEDSNAGLKAQRLMLATDRARTSLQMQNLQGRLSKTVDVGTQVTLQGEINALQNVYDNFDKQIKAIDSQMKVVTDLQQEIIAPNVPEKPYIDDPNPNAKGDEKQKDKITLLTELEKKLLDNATAITILREKQNLLSEDDVKRLTLLNDEIKLNKERQSLIGKQADQTRKEISALQSKKSLTDKEKKQIEDLQANLRGYREEWTSIESAINSSQKAIEDFGKKAKEEIEKKQEELAKFTIDLTKQVADALEKQDEERVSRLKADAERRIGIIEDELEAMERAYEETSANIEKDDINEKISKLTQERNMLAIEGSLDANARIYEIDEELVDLNKELKENERKSIYEKNKQRLEDRKKSINKEIDEEERGLKERKEKQEYYAKAKVMIEEGAMNSIVSLLKEYDTDFALDGETKGKAWLSAFMEQVKKASDFITNSGGSGAYGSGGTGGTYIPSPTTGGIHTPPSDGMVQYETGGVNDYTGLAQLDGTKSLPEVVLNPSQISNIAGSLGISGSPARMAHGLYNMAKSGVKSMGDTAVNVVMNVNAVINNSMDIADVSKQLAVGMNREIGKRGIRLNG